MTVDDIPWWATATAQQKLPRLYIRGICMHIELEKCRQKVVCLHVFIWTPCIVTCDWMGLALPVK